MEVIYRDLGRLDLLIWNLIALVSNEHKISIDSNVKQLEHRLRRTEYLSFWRTIYTKLKTAFSNKTLSDMILIQNQMIITYETKVFF